MNNGMFIIKKKSKIDKYESFINKYRVSNFNFMSQQRIIKLLKSSKILS